MAEVQAYLDRHINLEADPSAPAAAERLGRARELVALLGEPQRDYPVVHLTGTNGKGSSARIITALLMAKGLSVGTYTSPHLERINERIAWSNEPISEASFVDVVEAVARVEPLLYGAPSHFEILTAAALRWFADVAVDVAVVEVGLGGRWDATNVVDADVAVVTNVSLDHQDLIGPTLADIAQEKAGIVKAKSMLVLGETEPALAEVFGGMGAAQLWRRGMEFACTSNRMAYGGRMLELRTPGAEYPEVYLPVHGAHQGDNAALALAAGEAFFGAPLDPELVAEAFAGVRLPGRMEVMSRRPLVLLDGAHNPAGARALAASLAEEFPTQDGRVLVVGLLRGRDPAEMLTALGVAEARLVIACPPPSPRALPPEEVARAADEAGVPARVSASVPEAVARAMALADVDEQVVVTGSLYVVGAARRALAAGVG